MSAVNADAALHLEEGIRVTHDKETGKHMPAHIEVDREHAWKGRWGVRYWGFHLLSKFYFELSLLSHLRCKHIWCVVPANRSGLLCQPALLSGNVFCNSGNITAGAHGHAHTLVVMRAGLTRGTTRSRSSCSACSTRCCPTP